MKLESLQAVSLAIAQERSVEIVLQKIVEGLVAQSGVALARLWLKAPGDICVKCPMKLECPDQTECLHLMASAGKPTKTGVEDWSRLNGDFRRFPLGIRKIGKIGATGEPLLLADVKQESNWIAHPKWAESEGIQSFAGQPLIFRGQVLGVLAVFSRQPIAANEFAWLRMFADHAAVAIANSRAFAEIERLREQLKLENDYLREEVKQERLFGDIVGESLALKKVLDQISLVAQSDANVLVLGESGTGKELIARAIHDFQLADGGTLFLDEVGEIPLDLQSKLLRVLQEGTFERVGEEKTRRTNVRIVAATNRDLRREIAAGTFRQDLFFRLSVFPIELPPLRERREDIPLLARHFIQLTSQQTRCGKLQITETQMQRLQNYSWPGNVRELQNVIERAMILSSCGAQPLNLELILPENAASFSIQTETPAASSVSAFVPQAEFEKRERENLMAALEAANWKIYGAGGAAELLGVKPTTLASRLQSLGIKKTRG